MSHTKKINYLRNIIVLSILALSLNTFTGCAYTSPQQEIVEQKSTQAPAVIDANSFGSEVLQHIGPVVVLFHDDSVSTSHEMQKRFNHLANRYSNDVKFLTFNWDAAEKNDFFNLSVLPSTVFYFSGDEIDRIGGIPVNKEALRGWDEDVDLWILKTVLGAQGDDYSGRYVYRFNDTSKLQIGNY